MVVAGRVAHLERDLYSWMEVLDGRALEVRAGEKDQAIDPHLESIWSEIDGPAIAVCDAPAHLGPLIASLALQPDLDGRRRAATAEVEDMSGDAAQSKLLSKAVDSSDAAVLRIDRWLPGQLIP